MAEAKGPEVITPPNILKTKVGPRGPTEEDFKAIEKAEKVIEGMADKYVDVVAHDLASLQEAVEKLEKDVENRSEHLEKIFLVSHDMKGQGGSFGYPLVTIICNQLGRFIEKLESVGDPEIQVIALHIDAVNVVVRENMKDAGGGAAGALLKGLELVINKTSH